MPYQISALLIWVVVVGTMGYRLNALAGLRFETGPSALDIGLGFVTGLCVAALLDVAVAALLSGSPAFAPALLTAPILGLAVTVALGRVTAANLDRGARRRNPSPVGTIELLRWVSFPALVIVAISLVVAAPERGRTPSPPTSPSAPRRQILTPLHTQGLGAERGRLGRGRAAGLSLSRPRP